MTNTKTTKRALLSSVMAMLLCFTMLLGTTFAWFTDSVTSGNNIIKTGNLDMKLSYKPYGAENTEWTEVTESTILFGKDALYEPGYTEAVWLKVENLGSLAFRYDLAVNVASEKQGTNKAGEKFSLSDYLEVKYMTTTSTEMESNFYTTRESLDSFAWGSAANSGVASLKDEIAVIKNGVAFSANDATNGAYSSAYVLVVISMPTTVTNEANHNGTDIPQIDFTLTAVATQLAYESDSFGSDYDEDATYPEFPDIWNGTADVSWYLENPDATEFTLSSAEALAGLAALVDGTAAIPADASSEITLPVTFEGKTVKLDEDVDLNNICFDPIGSYRQDKAFTGTFDGQGHTIKNLSQNTWELNNGYYYGDLGLGLFGMVEDATIKNLNMDGADISGESAIVGIVAATAYGDCTFENIKVSNSKGADYQYYAGGIVGWASGNHQYINCDVDASTTIAAQWGDFDNSTGGIIGGAGGSATIYMKDCNVACRIDAYNDVTSSYQWYAYRRCGMLIGNPGKTVDVNGTTYADAPQLTCENVTVTYGEWANYTYCEFAGTNWPYVRVQAGISNSAYSNPRYGHPTDANGNEVVDDNHVHNDGEDHFVSCVFDQLYGGGQGVYGTPTHNGVTVIYNNK